MKRKPILFFVTIVIAVLAMMTLVACGDKGSGTKGLGTVVGAATIVTAFGMGPFIDWFNRKLVEPFFYRDHERTQK